MTVAYLRAGAVSLLLMAILIQVSGCQKEVKQASLQVTEKEFILRQDTDHSYVVDVRGKVKNSGPADAKNIVITGYCRSCGEVILNGKWFISDIEKTSDQKDTVSYLSAGAEETFEFKDLAFFMDQGGNKPGLPENLEIVIERYEVVE